MKQWNILSLDNKLTNKLANDLNVSIDISKLLIKRGITDFDSAKDFFRPNLDNTHDPFLMKGMDLAVDRLIKAKNSNEKVLIYGDYDVDGTTSVSMIYLFLASQAINCQFYIPDRYEEGYGLSKKGIDFAFKEKISLIITLDCGIRAVKQVNYANKKGIDIIICDHHNPGTILPEAHTILNPKQIDCNYPFKDLCGCGVGFKLISAYYIKNNLNIKETYSYLDLLALATVADIVPIIDENRIYTYYGLKKINQNPNKGLDYLIKRSERMNEIKSSDISFGIAPLINAAGRISHAKNAVKLLIENDSNHIKKYTEVLYHNNNERRMIEKKILEEALKKLNKDTLTNVVSSKKWHKGVIGIVASKLIDSHYKPTIIFAEQDGLLTGSARSIKGFNIYDAILSCEDLCEKFGGHKYAAGLTIKKENYELFKKRFELEVAAKLTNDIIKPIIEVDANLDLNKLDDKFYRILKQFAPFGPGNSNPVFASYGIKLKSPPKYLGEDKSHFKLLIKLDKSNIEAIGFNLSHLLNKQNDDCINLCYTLNENIWNNKKSLQLNIKDLF
tara:strand:+ start:1559 stop:3232 length:1674 start_codon:yes stop_codon:yes gene_type:complete